MTATATAASQYNAAAACIRHAIRHALGAGLTPSHTVVRDLERITGLLSDYGRSAATPPPAPAPLPVKVSQAPAVQPTVADREAAFHAAFAAAVPGYADRTGAVKAATYRLYCQAGLDCEAFIALGTDGRKALAQKLAPVPAPAAAQVTKPATPAPAPTAKPEPVKVAAQVAAPQVAKTPAPAIKAAAPKRKPVAGLQEYRRLKAACKAAGLDTTGKADALKARLDAHKAATAAKPVPAELPGVAQKVAIPADAKLAKLPEAELDGLWKRLPVEVKRQLLAVAR